MSEDGPARRAHVVTLLVLQAESLWDLWWIVRLFHWLHVSEEVMSMCLSIQQVITS
jgi:hypothetical protein